MNGLQLLAIAIACVITAWVCTPAGARWTSGPPHPDITYPDWTPQEETQ